MMFFLWGVFRGKRVNCLQEVSGSSKKFSGAQDLPTAIMSLPENICSVVQIDNTVPTCNRSSDVASDARFLIDLPCLSSTETINGGTKVISHLQKDICSKLTMEQPEYRLDFNSLPPIPKSPMHSWPEIRSTSTSLVMLISFTFAQVSKPKYLHLFSVYVG